MAQTPHRARADSGWGLRLPDLLYRTGVHEDATSHRRGGDTKQGDPSDQRSAIGQVDSGADRCPGIARKDGLAGGAVSRAEEHRLDVALGVAVISATARDSFRAGHHVK